MLARFLALPLVIIIMGIGAASMLVPAIHAAVTDNDPVARSFFYGFVLFGVVFALISVATSGYKVRRQARSHLLALAATYTVLPAMLAVPFQDAVGDTTFVNAYFEMVSALTTTGATLFDPDRLAPSVHLWRAYVGWMGGFFVWITAIAILAPLNLGGFEVRTEYEPGTGGAPNGPVQRVVDPSERLVRFTVRLFPVYGGLTLILWILLLIAGETPLVAVSVAMSTLATSGIAPEGAISPAGPAGEALIFLFMIFALSRLTYAADERPEGWRSLGLDPELRLGLVITLTLPLLLFLRHWIGAFEVDDVENLAAGLGALWGGLFTTLSFLTTTGFVSGSWETAQAWSGLDTTGLILMGLTVFGGGVATTAGGVKLLRVFALYMHGKREMERLVLPNSVGGTGRRIRRQGAQIAFIFFMLFAMSIALVMVALTIAGVSFEDALVLTIAGLTTTGPLTEVAGSTPVAIDTLSPAARAIFAAAMVLGRLETLAIIALLNPGFWRP
ncbi:MAG: potassium transporter TrkG [Pseudomonadota bacterium]